jgi:hypothetical protein
VTREATQVFILLVLVLTGFVSYQLYQHHDPYVEKVEVGFQGLAKIHPYLALQRYWEQQGHSVQFSRQLSAEPLTKEVTTLWLPIESLSDEANAFEHLKAFLRRGGVLITGFASSSPSQERWPTSTLELLGLKSISQDSKCGSTVLGTNEQETYTLNPQRSMTWTLSTKTISRLMVNDQPWWFSKPTLRRGQVHVFNDLSIFENEHIGKEQHASLSHALAQYLPQNGKVMIVLSGQGPSLPIILWRHVPLSLLTLALLIFLVWASHAQRFGPPLEIAHRRVQPGIITHLKASAHHISKTTTEAKPTPLPSSDQSPT